MADKDEFELVYGLTANEESYQKLLVDRYAGFLLKIVMDRGLSREDGLEVVNDTFYKAVKHISRFDVDKAIKFSAWLARIAINTAIDKYKQEEKSPIKQSIEARADKGIQDTERLWQSTGTHESEIGLLSKDLIKEALKKLNDTDQKILMGRACGQEHKEIAMLVNKNKNAVKVAYHRALKKLKKEYVNLLESFEDKKKEAALKAYLYNEDIDEKAAS